MSEFYLSRQLGEHRLLCVAPLSDRNIELSGQDVEDPSGYFLFEKRGAEEAQDVEILAHLTSEEAARKMARLLDLA